MVKEIDQDRAEAELLEALRERNQKHFLALREIIDGKEEVVIKAGSFEIELRDNDPKNDHGPIIVDMGNGEANETYHIYPWGLGWVSLSDGVVNINSISGKAIKLPGDLDFDATHENFPEEFCNQAEVITETIKHAKLVED